MAVHSFQEGYAEAFKEGYEGEGESRAHESGKFLVGDIPRQDDIAVMPGCRKGSADASGLPG